LIVNAFDAINTSAKGKVKNLISGCVPEQTKNLADESDPGFNLSLSGQYKVFQNNM